MLLWVASVKAVDFAYFLPGDFKWFFCSTLGIFGMIPNDQYCSGWNTPTISNHFFRSDSTETAAPLSADSRGRRGIEPPLVQCATRGPGGWTGSGGIHHGMLDTKGPPHDLRPSRIGHVPWNLEFVHRCWSGSETYLRDIWWYRISKLHPLQHYFEVNTGVNGLRQPQLWSPADIVLLTKPRNTRRHVAVCDVAVPRMADSADESGSSNWGGFRGPLSDSLGNGHSKRIQFLPEIGWSEVYTILYH